MTVKADEKLARINDKDGFTNIRNGEGTDFKVVGTVNKDDFFYCELTNSEWYKVTALKWTEAGSQLEGYIHKSKVQFIDDLPDTTKKRIIETIFETQKQSANKFQNAWRSKDSLAYQTTVRALEDYSDNKYSPILPIFAYYFCKTRDIGTLNKLFATIWADKSSANEEPSFTLGDCFVCNSDIVLKQLKNIKSKEQRQLLISDIEWGLRFRFNMPDEDLGIPDNPNKKQIEEFSKLKKKLKQD